MNRPDILIFMSDQHSATINGFAGNELVETPNLDRIASQGTVFDAAYTSCPLCVPARSSMLTGQLPSQTGIFTNGGVIPGDQATFIHSLAAIGYETVLCGRMHFREADQRHGFTKRIMGDISSLYIGSNKFQEKIGPYQGTSGMKGCLDLIGGGTSPVLEYDKSVIQTALNYLKHPHDRPQCVVVGTYGPHFPYVAPVNLFQYYRDKITLPESFISETNCDHSVYDNKKCWQQIRYNKLKKENENVNENIVLGTRAAYFGMITALDKQIGFVKEAWDNYLEEYNKKGIFVYLSDHGDTAGEHQIFGKQTFFEGSARIPLVFAGEGIKEGYRIKGATSIMDLGPTLCEMTGAPLPPNQAGKSLVNSLIKGDDYLERYILSEFMDQDQKGQVIPGRMVRQGSWKLITYDDSQIADLLFDVESDPCELNNLAEEYPEKKKILLEKKNTGWQPEKLIEDYKRKSEHIKILKKWGQIVKPEEDELWQVPEKARELPGIIV